MIPRLLRTEQAVARVAEAGHNIPVIVELGIDRRREDGDIRVYFGEGAGALSEPSTQMNFSRLAPLSFSRSTAAIAECAVASIGSQTMTSRSPMSAGIFM